MFLTKNSLKRSKNLKFFYYFNKSISCLKRKEMVTTSVYFSSQG